MSTLDRLAGTWTFTMRHSAMTEPVTGMQVYRWVLDGTFLQQDWTYEHPDFPDAIAMLDEHHLHHFDVRGITRVFDLTLDEAGWWMIRRDDDFWQRDRTLHRRRHDRGLRRAVLRRGRDLAARLLDRVPPHEVNSSQTRQRSERAGTSGSGRCCG